MFKFLGKVWKFITVIRTGLANLIFLAIILFFIFAIVGNKPPGLPNNAPLLVTISGSLVDKKAYEPTMLDFLSGEQRDPETLVRDVTFAINEAKNDTRISALILNLNHLRSAGLSKIEEVGQAIESFRESEKPIIAYADSYSQSQYLLASYADEIYINDMGNIALTGFGIYQSYFKEAADKLALKFHLFKAGNFKDAAEPYVRNTMSEASREHKSLLINELWSRYTSKIETRRNLPSGAVTTFIEGFKDTLKDSEDTFASITQKAGFVDHVVSRVELNTRLIEQFGKDKDSDFFEAIGFKQYLNHKKPRLPQQSSNIGLIVASGTIVDGEGGEGQIGGNSLSALIREATNDNSLEALVIRIDSGGGSAFASEVIRDELENARAANLPVFVSMGSVAASGGYWIAAAAEEIWALPSTITGSIGVWGLLPNVSGSLKKIGVHNDGLGTTSLSDIYQIDRPLSPDAQQVFQSGVDNIYDQFINLVAESRGQTADDIHRIAQGRVWSGAKAMEFGLVDQLGSLDDLMKAIGEKLDLSKIQVKVIEHPMSTSEQFLRALMEEAEFAGNQMKDAILGDEVSTLLNHLPKSDIARAMERSSYQGVRYFAECLSCIAP